MALGNRTYNGAPITPYGSSAYGGNAPVPTIGTTGKKMTANATGGAGTGVATPQGAFGAPDPNPVPLYKPQVETEDSLIQKQANARMIQARQQADMNKAAMLQSENESAYRQGLDPSTNAFKANQQRAIDTAGQTSLGILNDALSQNTADLSAEKQRNDALKLEALQMALNDPSIADNASAKQNIYNQIGDLSNAEGLGNLVIPDANANIATDKITTMFKDRGLDVNDPFVKEQIALAQKAGPEYYEKYIAIAGGNKAAALNSVSDLNSSSDSDIKDMLSTQSGIDTLNKLIGMGKVGVDQWSKKASKGDILMDNGVAYRVVSDPKGKGKILKNVSTGDLIVMKNRVFYNAGQFLNTSHDESLNSAIVQAIMEQDRQAQDKR